MRRIATLLLVVTALWGPALAGVVGKTIQKAMAQSKKGDHLSALKLYEQAAKDFDQASVGEKDAIRKGLFDEATSLIEKQNYEPAIRGLVALLPLSRRGGSCQSFAIQVRMVLEYASMTMILSGRPQLAIPALEALMQDSPGTPMRWSMLARAYLETGDFNRAGRTLRRALSLHPDSPELLYVKASLAGSMARREVVHSGYQRAEFLMQDAISDLQAALVREPRIGGIHRALGTLRASLWVYYRATGQYEKALKMLDAAEVAFTDASHLDPENPEPAFELGNLLFTAQDWIYSEVWLREAHVRYDQVARQAKYPKVARDAAQRGKDRCEQIIASAYFNRAIDAANTARFDLARGLLQAASRKMSCCGSQSNELLGWVVTRRRAFQRQVDRLSSQSESGDAQVVLGDLWMRARRYEQARMAYRRALKGRLKAFTVETVKDRIYGTLELEDQPKVETVQIGSMDVSLELPASADLAFFQSLLQKAHATTMSAFPHRLNAPLGIKVFINRRAFLEQAAPRVGIHQAGFYAFGRIVTFHEPGRTRNKWLEILEHEIIHRYVDEMTYSHAPSWLSEGLALWVSEGWPQRKNLQMERFASEGRLIPWGEMEKHYTRHWNDPDETKSLYLQSHHMAYWLVERFTFERLMVLLAALRTGQALDAALVSAYGLPLEIMELHWEKELH